MKAQEWCGQKIKEKYISVYIIPSTPSYTHTHQNVTEQELFSLYWTFLQLNVIIHTQNIKLIQVCKANGAIDH